MQGVSLQSLGIVSCDRVIKPLQQMGAQIWGRKGNCLAPLAIQDPFSPIKPDSHITSTFVTIACEI
jgi:5-enolpyruvylshikimate-3-phosphate synthase